MRCPDCNKFVSLELQEPELDNLEVSHDAPETDQDVHTFTITGSVRIVRTCGECGQELKEATLDIEQSVELGENLDPDFKPDDFAKAHDLDDCTVEDADTESIEEGGGRYAKSYFGAQVTFNVIVDRETVATVTWSDKVAASEMDELV